jgi:nucleoid DNA-binding protein
MKTKDLVTQTAEITGELNCIVREVLETALLVIADELAEGGTIKLKGIGRLSTQRQAPAVFVDTRQGRTQEIKGPRLVHFAAAVQLLRDINLREVS